MNKYLISIFSFLAFGASAQAIQSIDEAGQLLSKVSGVSVRPFSTRDFGRERYSKARSVLVPQNRAQDILNKVRKNLSPMFIAFVGTTNNLESKNSKDFEIVVAEGKNQFDIVKVAATNAVNYEKSTDQIISKLKKWDSEYGIDIWQAETDTIQLSLKKQPKDIKKFSQEVYEFCPDIVDQGVGSVEALELEIVKSKAIYLWWD